MGLGWFGWFVHGSDEMVGVGLLVLQIPHFVICIDVI